MPDQPDSESREKELRIGVLRILEHQQNNSDEQPGGASGKVLMELLDLNDVLELEKILFWLKESGFIEIGSRKFLITESGQEFLRSTLSKE